MRTSDTIVILGNRASWSLERSYERALQQLGYQTQLIDVATKVQKQIPMKRVMHRLRHMMNDRKWVVSANREIAVELLDLKPGAIFVFCNAEILLGTLALLETATSVKKILIWPDTPFNLSPEVRSSIPLYDLVCTYSSASVRVFNQLGSRNTMWVPLAADPDLHYLSKAPDSYTYDISFIGNWRPEREEALLKIVERFPEKKVAISGVFWKAKAKNKDILRYVAETSLTGKDYAAFINRSFINLNIIDKTNTPAANMRFFEIPVAYGFQLSSSCPEQEQIFIEGEHLMYFNHGDDLISKIEYCFSNIERIETNRTRAHELILSAHTYRHRAEAIMTKLSVS